MARRVKPLSVLIQARRERRRDAQHRFNEREGLKTGEIKPAGELPHGIRERLREKLKAGQLGVEVGHGPLTSEQQRALAAFKNSNAALSRAVGEREDDELTPEEVHEDQPLCKLIARRDRAASRVIKLDLENHPDAISIVQEWLAFPRRIVPKGNRRRLGVSRETGTRKDLTLEDVWLAVELRNILDDGFERQDGKQTFDPTDAEPILKELLARLREYAVTGGPLDKAGRPFIDRYIGGKSGATALADRVNRMKGSSWREKLAKLLAD